MVLLLGIVCHILVPVEVGEELLVQVEHLVGEAEVGEDRPVQVEHLAQVVRLVHRVEVVPLVQVEHL